MVSALIYLQFHSMKNRLAMRLKRLKQPKYLIGAIVGGLYFYWYFFRFLFAPRGRMAGVAPEAALPAVDPLLYESIGALILLAFMLLAWVIPHKRAALAFTEAEVAFLFPAPISRRGLIHFKLLRSQLAILFTVVFLTLIFNRYGSFGHRLTRVAGWWVILSTLNLHFLGSSFALTKLMDRGISTWKRRLGVLALVFVGLGAVGLWAAREMPPLTSADLADFNSIKDYFERTLVSGPLPYLLFPFRLVVRPYLAANGLAFLVAVGPALLLLALHYVWVIRSDVSFEEASVEASQKLAEKIAAVRAGNWQAAGKKFKRKRPPFELRPSGPRLMALVWKNLINAGSGFTARTWIILAAVLVAMSFGMRGVSRNSNWLVVLGSFALMIGIWALLIGPQIVRQDFRQDLPNVDLLKLYPLRGWQLALGEILAPTLILTGVQWLLLLVAVAFAGPLASGKMSVVLIVALGVSIAVVLPALNLISLLIPNAAVLWFPSWFQAGKEGPQGIEATGQRLIFALGQFLAFILALIPAAAVFAACFFLIKFLADVSLAVLTAGVVATLVLAIEGSLGVMLLGWLFERFDVSAEQT